MKERLQKDLISAMKEHNRKKADTIKSVKAAIQMEEINSKKELSEEEMLSIVTKQVKLRKDAVKDFEKAGRQDLIDSYNEEISPKLKNRADMGEVNKIIKEKLSQI